MPNKEHIRYLVFETKDGKILRANIYTGLGKKIINWMNGVTKNILYTRWNIDITDIISNLNYKGFVYKYDPILENSVELRTYISCALELRPKCVPAVYYGFLLKGKITGEVYKYVIEPEIVKRVGKSIDSTNIHEPLKMNRDLFDHLFKVLDCVGYTKINNMNYKSIRSGLEMKIYKEKLLFNEEHMVCVSFKTSHEPLWEKVVLRNTTEILQLKKGIVVHNTLLKHFRLPRNKDEIVNIMPITNYLLKYGIDIDDIRLRLQLNNKPMYLIVKDIGDGNLYKIYTRNDEILNKLPGNLKPISAVPCSGRFCSIKTLTRSDLGLE